MKPEASNNAQRMARYIQNIFENQNSQEMGPVIKHLKVMTTVNRHCTGALIFPDLSWFVKLHTFGKMVPQFAYLSNGSFLYESLTYSLLYLRSESYRAILLWRNYRISITKTQTCLQALRLFSAYNTIGTARCSECTHFQWLRKNLILILAFIKYY